MRKKIIFAIFLFCFCTVNVRGITYNGCDYSELSRMKSLVTNVNISYDYYINNSIAYFNVRINNITPDMYFVDVANQKTYTYASSNSGEIIIERLILSGSLKFYSASADCYGVSLGTKYYTLPVYNPYFEESICDDIREYKLCKKWTNADYSYGEFKTLINKYKESLKSNEENPNKDIEYSENFINVIVNFYVKYYYYFLTVIIIICGGIILVNRKRDKFKF